MTDYYTHNSKATDWPLVDAPQPGGEPVMVSEATTAEDRAAFTWAWQRACREQGHEAYAALMLEGAQ